MKQFAVKYALPLLILIIAFHQFVMVYFSNLTRWKGGGFGMYSEMHPLNRQVWIKTADSTWQIITNRKMPGKISAYARRLSFNPNEMAMAGFAKIAATHYKTAELTIEVWEPTILDDSQCLTRKMIKRYEHGK